MTEDMRHYELDIHVSHYTRESKQLVGLDHCPICGTSNMGFLLCPDHARCTHCGVDFIFSYKEVFVKAVTPELPPRTLWKKFNDNKVSSSP